MSEPVGQGPRFLAKLLDVVIIFSLLMIPAFIIPESDDAYAVLGLVMIGSWFIYAGTCNAIWSCTIGKRVMGLIVVDKNGFKAPWWKTYLRAALEYTYAIAGLVWIVTLCCIPYSEKRRSWVDFVAGTMVTRKPSLLKPNTPPPLVNPSPRHGQMNFDEEIMRLATLKDQGLITDQEFSDRKRKILGI